MLLTRPQHEYRVDTAAAILPAIVGADKLVDDSSERQVRLAAEQALDQVLADSFPASDPPSWNPGIALRNPALGLKPQAERAEAGADTEATARASDIIDMSRSSGVDQTSLRGFVSLAGTAVIALLVPFVIFLPGRRSRSPFVACSSY